MLTEILKIFYQRCKTVSRWPAATVEYPHVVKQPPHGARVGLRNNFAECIGCHKCEAACPVNCISIVSEDFPSREKVPKTSRGVVFEKRVTSFKIDFNLCVNCGICVEICPTDSLTTDKTFVLPRQNSKHLLVDLVHRPRVLRKEQGYEE